MKNLSKSLILFFLGLLLLKCPGLQAQSTNSNNCSLYQVQQPIQPVPIWKGLGLLKTITRPCPKYLRLDFIFRGPGGTRECTLYANEKTRILLDGQESLLFKLKSLKPTVFRCFKIGLQSQVLHVPSGGFGTKRFHLISKMVALSPKLSTCPPSK